MAWEWAWKWEQETPGESALLISFGCPFRLDCFFVWWADVVGFIENSLCFVLLSRGLLFLEVSFGSIWWFGILVPF